MTSTSSRIGLVLFDLSGVLADFRGAHELGRLIGGLPEDQVWPRWLESPWMRRFDAGDCSADEFAAGIVAEWELQLPAAEFLDGFRTWMLGPYPGAEDLVRMTQQRVVSGCLSNMNPIHWQELERWDLIDAFTHRFISCELGLVKPDHEIYAHATEAVGLEPERILFLDDNLVNVQAARQAGLQAAHVRGVGGAQEALARHGLIDQPADRGAGMD